MTILFTLMRIVIICYRIRGFYVIIALYKSTFTYLLNYCTVGYFPVTSVLFCARQHVCYSALYAIARPSVTRVDQSKTVEVRITQHSPQSSPHDSSFLMLNFTVKFQGEDREWGAE